MPNVWINAKNLNYAVTGRDAKLSILSGVDFTANAGEFIGIVGPNGAGKTTLIKSIAGLIPAKGKILIQTDGSSSLPLFSYPARERAKLISFMHQDTSVPFAFTVREVIAMGRNPWTGRFSTPSSKDAAAVTEAMKKVGCHDLADRFIHKLSGGERQRVMLARALAQDTPFLFLDEPTSSLDIGHAGHVFSLCRTLALEGKCVVAVLHDLRQAAKACTRLYLLHNGGVIAKGTPDDVLTAKNIENSYQVQIQIFRNPAGEWDFYLENGN